MDRGPIRVPLSGVTMCGDCTGTRVNISWSEKSLLSTPVITVNEPTECWLMYDVEKCLRMTQIRIGKYHHEKYGEVQVAKVCSVVHFTVIETGERTAELHDLFAGNTVRIE